MQSSAALTQGKKTEGPAFLAEVSSGEKVADPRHERRDRTRLARARSELARKVTASANQAKAGRRVAEVHARIADRRRDFLHHLTSRVVHENQVVVIECAWYGRELVVPDRFFPSSGVVHDQGVNAARSILAAGPAASACGDGVRPQRESSRTGRSSVKRETQRATAGMPRLSAREDVKRSPSRSRWT